MKEYVPGRRQALIARPLGHPLLLLGQQYLASVHPTGRGPSRKGRLATMEPSTRSSGHWVRGVLASIACAVAVACASAAPLTRAEVEGALNTAYTRYQHLQEGK